MALQSDPQMNTPSLFRVPDAILYVLHLEGFPVEQG